MPLLRWLEIVSDDPLSGINLEVKASKPGLRDMLASAPWSGLLFTTVHQPIRKRSNVVPCRSPDWGQQTVVVWVGPSADWCKETSQFETQPFARPLSEMRLCRQVEELLID